MISDYISEGTGGDPDWNRNFSLGVHQTNSFESNKKIQSFIIQGIITHHVCITQRRNKICPTISGNTPVYRSDEPSIWEELFPNSGIIPVNEGKLIFDQVRYDKKRGMLRQYLKYYNYSLI